MASANPWENTPLPEPNIRYACLGETHQDSYDSDLELVWMQGIPETDWPADGFYCGICRSVAKQATEEIGAAFVTGPSLREELVRRGQGITASDDEFQEIVLDEGADASAGSALQRVGGFARICWRGIRFVGLVTADVIIWLSLQRRGRPRPGERTSWPRGLREALSRRQGGVCMYCRTRLNRVPNHIDHKIPVNQGGTNDPANLQLLCRGCNLRKSDRSDTEFRVRFGRLLPPQGPSRRRIRQGAFDAETRRTRDTESYSRFKAGKYLTPAYKVSTGALVTGIAVFLVLLILLDNAFGSRFSSAWLIISLIAGVAAGLGIRLRARVTGQDQERD